MKGKLLFGCLLGFIIVYGTASRLHRRSANLILSAFLGSSCLPAAKPMISLVAGHCTGRSKHRMMPFEVHQTQVMIGFLEKKFIPSVNTIDENDPAPALFCPDDLKVSSSSRGASTQCITPEVLDLIKEEALNLASQDRAAARALAQVKLTWAPKKKKHAALSYSGNLIPFMLEKLNFEMPPACEIIDGKLIFPSVRLD